ncbi:hypothetical protein HQ571_02380 [Candidatus Kuenenbacteria bacterium]|nr:hypothetical protein [Candidatus Kuenenbacteria bacterium]
MHHMTPQQQQTWNDARRAAFITLKVRAKAAAQKFFSQGQVFDLKIYEKTLGDNIPSVSRSYVIESSSENFWTALEKELTILFNEVPGYAKNFCLIPFQILLNGRTVHNYLPRPTTSRNKVLCISFSRATKPRSL